MPSLAPDRRARLCYVIVGVIAAFGAAGCHRRWTGDVVLIVVDTLRADHLSLYGYGHATSPNLEAFARDAITFDDAISPGTWTVPSHASLFTGRWPSFHGAERVAASHPLCTPISPDVPTLAELLRTVGFHSTAFVANSGYVARILGFGRGFDDYFDYEFNYASEISAKFHEWLPRQTGRLFVFMNILDPHEPYSPPAPYDTLFPGKHPEYGTDLSPIVNAHQPVTKEMIDHFVSQYDGEIAFTDANIARILQDLKHANRYEGALIIVTSDHGELLGEHGLAGHGIAPYEELIHVPLVVKFPFRRGAGTRVARRVSTLGVFATVMKEIPLTVPPGVQSIPLEQDQLVWAEDVREDGTRIRVGYSGSRKLVEEESAAGVHAHLFDLAADPDELHPVVGSEDGLVLRQALATFAAQVRPVHALPPPPIDPEREWKLRALGYIK